MKDTKTELIRNFCIIAHIDHGKTTLSDRLLEATNTVDPHHMKDQLLDSMDRERERGITIKCHPVTMTYHHEGKDYLFNLIDTPGHVDFSYEVSRSLAACEGALLLVDAAQGIEAQTVANAHMAMAQGLEIIPIINKIDLPGADPDAAKRQLEEVLAIPAEDAILASAKSGIGISEILASVVKNVPGPRLLDYGSCRLLVFDSIYDTYKGVICYVRIFSGEISTGDVLLMMSNGNRVTLKEVGRFSPSMKPMKTLSAGMVGYLVTNIKDVNEIQVGDTLTQADAPAEEMLTGYKQVTPMVFSGIYPLDTSDFVKLKNSLGKLRLNDAALQYQPENSAALGFGFRCGFLGLLHMEIIQERIRREYDLDILSTYPSVVYKITDTTGKVIEMDNPVKMPDPSTIEKIEEPTIVATIHIPSKP